MCDFFFSFCGLYDQCFIVSISSLSMHKNSSIVRSSCLATVCITLCYAMQLLPVSAIDQFKSLVGTSLLRSSEHLLQNNGKEECFVFFVLWEALCSHVVIMFC
jgi:hypothetical protein